MATKSYDAAREWETLKCVKPSLFTPFTFLLSFAEDANEQP